MGEVLIDGIEHVGEVLLTILMENIGQRAKLSVQPASACAHEGVGARELAEHILLQEGFDRSLKLSGATDVLL